jgi:hypothetical protein
MKYKEPTIPPIHFEATHYNTPVECQKLHRTGWSTAEPHVHNPQITLPGGDTSGTTYQKKRFFQ